MQPDYYSFFTGADLTGEEYVIRKSDKNNGNTTDCGPAHITN